MFPSAKSMKLVASASKFILWYSRMPSESNDSKKNDEISPVMNMESLSEFSNNCNMPYPSISKCSV